MSMNMECFDLNQLAEDGETTEQLLLTAVRDGKPVRAYSGLYFNHWYKNLQIVAGAVIDSREEAVKIVSGHSHCAGMSTWKCRVQEEITPEGRSGLDMRLLVKPLSEDEEVSKSFTVVDVINADVLPSYAPGEIIELQVIGKAKGISFYADEDAFAKAEGRKMMLPSGENKEKKEQTLTVGPGYPMPTEFMHHHFKKTKEEAEAARFTDEDKWVYVRGDIPKVATYSAVFSGGGEDEEIRWVLPAIPLDTYFGKLDILFSAPQISEDQKELVKPGDIVSTVCEIQGDPLLDEYEKGMVINQKNNMMAVRYAFSSGKIKRLLPILSDHCRYYSESHEKEIIGKEEIVKYLEDSHRYITEEQGCREFTAYGFVVNDDEEAERYGLEHRYGETCVAIGIEQGDEKGWSQFVFFEFDGEGKISQIIMSDGEHYRFSDPYESWAEMEEALKEG